MPDDDQGRAAVDGRDDGIGIGGQVCCVVIGGQIRGHYLVATGAQHGNHRMPRPTRVSSTVDQHEGAQ